MKLLWVKTDFLHPTTKGGHIRTLEMLKRLHARHEVHYVGFTDPAHPDQVDRAAEYASRVYPIAYAPPPKRSLAFMASLLGGLASPLPVACSRWRSSVMRAALTDLLAAEHYDAIICDFLFPATNFPRLDDVVLFQHNVETTIWQRHHEHAGDPLRRFYFGLQARRMRAWEGTVCRAVRRVVAVSDIDAALMRDWFGIENVSAVPTGVDTDYFEPKPSDQRSDLVFVGSMDWLPNIDGMTWFLREVLPLIRADRPETSLTIVGREPTPDIMSLATQAGGVTVTGTVPDIRPYLWGASVSIVPLRIGGGTRLKIYEAMAAGVPIVSTTVGAEGLSINPPRDILIADSPAATARACLDLLANPEARKRQASAARQLVLDHFSWDRVTDAFEAAVVGNPG